MPNLLNILSIGNLSAPAISLNLPEATRVSKSGALISAMSPQAKRERSRSSRFEISFGGRSEVIIICFLSSCRALNV